MKSERRNKIGLFFNELSSKDVALAGGKGASLGEMTQAGISVPPGFVILSTVFEKFLEETDLNVEIDSILHNVDHKEIHTVEDAAEKINSLIVNAEMPRVIGDEIQKFFKKLGAEYVAVRSSATAEDSSTAAWAGQLESYLNTTEKNLLENVKKCWASLFTPRAIFYRFEKGLHKQKISVAVVVQKMVESEKSGIAFSVHPVTQDRNQLIIEAGFGLGEAIVSGQITPDSYVIDKQDWNILDININEQSRGLFRNKKGGNEWQELGEKGKERVLSKEEIIELSKLIIKIEKHYGFPVDVEWAREKNKFYIVQSRPITTLIKEERNEKEKIILTKKFSREHSLFYLENWSYSEIYHTSKILGGHMKNLIYLSEPGNPQVSSWYDLKEVTRLYGLVVEKAKKPSFFKWIEEEFERLWGEIEPYIRKRKKINSIYELRKFRENVIEFYGPYTAAYVSPDIPELDGKYKKLSLKLRERVQDIINDIDEVYLDFFIVKFPDYGAIANFLTAEEIFSLEKSNFPDSKLKEIEERKEKGYFLLNNKLYLYNKLVKVLKANNLNLENYKIKKKVFTKEHSREYSLFRLAIWYNSMKEGLKKIIGDGITEACGVYKGEDLVSVYYEPDEIKRVFRSILRKCEEKEYMMGQIKNYLDLFDQLKQYYTGKRKIKDLKELRKVQEIYAFTWAYVAIIFVVPTFPVDEELKKFALDAREKSQEYNETPEIIFKEVLERFFPKLKGKMRFVLPEEIWTGEVENPNFIKKINERKKGFIYYKEKVYTGNLQENLDELGINLEDKKSAVSGEAQYEGNEIKGQIAYKGKVRGVVKKVSKVSDIDKVKKGDILVAAMTMPKYLPAMRKAAAFVTDEGGITCHAAIVAREFKKPCIIGTKVATEVLQDGDLVEVDANGGVVRIL